MFKPSMSTARLWSESLEKFIKTQKNLSKTSPRLWFDHDEDDLSDVDDQGFRRLKLNHPILRTLDSCDATVGEFNQVHAQLVVSGLFQHPLAASRVVKKLCSMPSAVSHAIKLFHRLEEPDAFICNTIMRSFVNFNDPESALTFYYHQMVGKRVLANHYTFPIVIKACADLGLVREGAKIHASIVKTGFELNLFVRNTLINMYSLCGRIWDARKVFDLSPESDLVTWNSMIDGYVKNKEMQVARSLFDEMPDRDIISWNSMIAGYAAFGDMESAKEFLEETPFRDAVSWNCLVDGYARIGDAEAAREVFDKMDFRNVVSWNSMLALYVRKNDYDECLRLFNQMMEGDAKPNEATLMSILTACARLQKLDLGKWVHSYLRNNSKIEPDMLLSTSLLNMYAKCGDMDLAKEVFDEMPEKSIVTWNSMIMGYGTHGYGERALEMMLEMERSGQRPNDATFVCILSACTHAGLILEGWWYFHRMLRVYNIEPKVDHYGCMVDLLSSAGLMEDRNALWGALVLGCKSRSNLELGEHVAKRLIEMEPGDIGAYVLLSYIYSIDGRWVDVENVRQMMMLEKGLQGVAGFSLVHFLDYGFESCHTIDSAHTRSMVHSMLSDISGRYTIG